MRGLPGGPRGGVRVAAWASEGGMTACGGGTSLVEQRVGRVCGCARAEGRNGRKCRNSSGEVAVLNEVADGIGDWDIRKEEVRWAEDTSRRAVCRVRLAWHIGGADVKIAGEGVDKLVYASEGFVGRRMPVTSIGPAFDNSRVVAMDGEG